MGSRAAGHGCPECYSKRRREQGPREVSADRSLKGLYPKVAAEWDRSRNGGLDPAAISPKSKQKVWWRCRTCGHTWRLWWRTGPTDTGAHDAVSNGERATQSHVAYDRSLAARYPGLIGELHPTRNSGLDSKQLGARSSLKVWWRCSACGHEWKAAVASRTYAGTGCPVCGLDAVPGRRARWIRRARSRSRHPEIAAQLHPSRNQAIDPAQLGARSGLKLWWRCGAWGTSGGPPSRRARTAQDAPPVIEQGARACGSQR